MKMPTEGHLQSAEELLNISDWKERIPALAADADDENKMNVDALDLQDLQCVQGNLKKIYSCLKPCRPTPVESLSGFVNEWKQNTKQFSSALRLLTDPEHCCAAVFCWQCWFVVRQRLVTFTLSTRNNIVFQSCIPVNVADASEFLLIFHGCKIYGLRSIVKNGLTESENEGGRRACMARASTHHQDLRLRGIMQHRAECSMNACGKCTGGRWSQDYFHESNKFLGPLPDRKRH